MLRSIVSRGYKTLPGGCYGYRIRAPLPDEKVSASALANRAKHADVYALVNAFRSYGHRQATIDPLELMNRTTVSELQPESHGLTAQRLNDIIPVEGLVATANGDTSMRVADMIAHLRATYCGHVGAEFQHLPEARERTWWAEQLEKGALVADTTNVTAERRSEILSTLVRSEVFDHFMQKKFPQVKRYGAEGAESYLVAVDEMMRTANQQGVHDVVLAMPHRGRLNLLIDRLGLSPSLIFSKIRGQPEFPTGTTGFTADVLSHLRNSVDIAYSTSPGAHPLHASLIPNPSHLEACNPVALGKTRARQQRLSDGDYRDDELCRVGDKAMCLTIHGDAAFCAQGVVMESLSLSQLPHYTVGGTAHLIVNNQIGFTTPADRARSSMYSSDIGKMIDTPVLHVNGDSVHSVLLASRLAVEYRMKFRKDVIVDLLCFRRHGHNEMDDPSLTQPVMYGRIKARKSIPVCYADSQTSVSQDEIAKLRQSEWEKLEGALRELANFNAPKQFLTGRWSEIAQGTDGRVEGPVATGVATDILRAIGRQSVSAPAQLKVHDRLKRLHLNARLKRLDDSVADSDATIDWATAEAMAFGSLMGEGHAVRISGQDVGRGTFSHRHAMLIDQQTDETYLPLNELPPSACVAPSGRQSMLEIANSNLAEFSVLGFEYGASTESPSALVMWEAQFGDFFNGAQIIIDTFVASGETKWLQQSGLVMLLPHGYDGAGPEHSSCRLERFLQLTDSAFDGRSDTHEGTNMSVCVPSTPAQYFHMLRRQLKRTYRKPLVVAGPKTLLRLRACQSSLIDMQPGTSFQPVLQDPLFASADADTSTVKRVLLTSGKIYYDLVDQEARSASSTAIVRIEELCPFPGETIVATLAAYPADAEIVWCQEEPTSMGAYSFVAPRLESLLGRKIRVVSRPVIAAPAVAYSTRHSEERDSLFKAALE